MGKRGPRNETELRRLRERTYRWLAAVHAGPLGMALAGHPELAPAYAEAYARCPGHPELACRAAGGVPAVCLPRQFEELAESARKGGLRRRQSEARRVRSLLRCAEVLEAAQPPAFAPIWRLTRNALEEDLKRLSPEEEAVEAAGR